MEYRHLGSSGLKVSTLGLGTWTFGWVTDPAEAEKILDAATDSGINLIDTADRYGRPDSAAGTAERIIGRWLVGQPRERFVLATKVRGRMGEGPNDEGLSRHAIMRGVEASLRRLRTDYIDLYQAHWPDPDTALGETLRAFDDLIRQGKVRYIGASNYPSWLACKALWISDRNRWAQFESLQLQYSLVHRAEYEREILGLCLDQGLGVLAYSPLGEGFLTGKYSSSGSRVNKGTRAAVRPEVRRFFTSENRKLLGIMREIAEARKISLAQLAIAWALHRPGITAAILGVRDVSQLRENWDAASVRLSYQEMRRLNEASVWKDERTPLSILPIPG